MSKEADIVISGQRLTEAQSMTLCVAIQSFLLDLRDPNHLGEDETGRAIASGYKERAREIQELISRTRT